LASADSCRFWIGLCTSTFDYKFAINILFIYLLLQQKL
jgi:hypothetical protein